METLQTLCVPATEANLGRAVEILRGGGLVAFPTETVYGLGANALDAAAVRRIFEAKGRPANNPVIVHIGDVSQVHQLVADWPEQAARLAERFWPGPLTLVLPKQSAVPDEVTAGGPTVAIRVPAHPVAQALLQAAQLPIAAPSANRSMELSPTTAAHVFKSLNGIVEMILDGGPCTGGIESTVVDLVSDPPGILRPGLIRADEIESVIGPLQAMDAGLSTGALRSPGLLARHYSPRTPLHLASDDGQELVHSLVECGIRVGWVTWPETPSVAKSVRRNLPRDADRFAQELYAVLHELDSMNLDQIVVSAVPTTPEWMAIRDRLKRASQS